MVCLNVLFLDSRKGHPVLMGAGLSGIDKVRGFLTKLFVNVKENLTKSRYNFYI